MAMTEGPVKVTPTKKDVDEKLAVDALTLYQLYWCGGHDPSPCEKPLEGLEVFVRTCTQHPEGLAVLTLLEPYLIHCGTDHIQTLGLHQQWYEAKRNLLGLRRAELFLLGARSLWYHHHYEHEMHWHGWLNAELCQREMSFQEKDMVWNGHYCWWLTSAARYLKEAYPVLNPHEPYPFDNSMQGTADDMDTPVEHRRTHHLWIHCGKTLLGLHPTLYHMSADETDQDPEMASTYRTVDGNYVDFENVSEEMTPLQRAILRVFGFAQHAHSGVGENVFAQQGLLNALTDYMTMISWSMVTYYSTVRTGTWTDLLKEGPAVSELRRTFRMSGMAFQGFSMAVQLMCRLYYFKEVLGYGARVLRYVMNGYERVHPCAIAGLFAMDTLKVPARTFHESWDGWLSALNLTAFYRNVSTQATAMSTVHQMENGSPFTKGECYIYDLPQCQPCHVPEKEMLLMSHWPVRFTGAAHILDTASQHFMFHYGIYYNVTIGNQHMVVGDSCGLVRNHLVRIRDLNTSLLGCRADELQLIGKMVNAYFYVGFHHPVGRISGSYKRSYTELATGMKSHCLYFRSYVRNDPLWWLLWIQTTVAVRYVLEHGLHQSFLKDNMFGVRLAAFCVEDCDLLALCNGWSTLVHSAPKIVLTYMNNMLLKEMYKNTVQKEKLLFYHARLMPQVKQLLTEQPFKHLASNLFVLLNMDALQTHSPSPCHPVW